ncbi:MAG: class I SAM-dependent DNA methyltransferase [Candidatus Kryptoniota bacterium]
MSSKFPGFPDLFTMKAMEMPPYTESAAIYDHMMRIVNYSGWARYLINLIRIANGSLVRKMSRPSVRLLDLACGTANLSLIFARKGYSVTAIDGSPEMLSIAKLKAQKMHLSTIHFIQSDLLSFKKDCEFDIALCTYDSINYLKGIDSIGILFSNIYQSLKTSGVFIFDLSMENNSLYDADLFDQKGKQNGTFYHRKSYYESSSKTHKTYIRILRKGELFEEVHNEYVYALPEVREKYLSTGFAEIGAFGDFTYLPATEKSDRVHFVLMKQP